MQVDEEVYLPGSLLMSLVHDAAVSVGDIEGFLFGQIEQRVVKVIEDREEEKEKIVKRIIMQSYVISGGPFSFYDNGGAVDIETVHTMINRRPNMSMLGWFKCRRGCVAKPSLREAAVHKSLMSCLSSPGSSLPPSTSSLLMGVMALQLEPGTSGFDEDCTRGLEYSFVKHVNGSPRMFSPVSVKPLSLQSTSEKEYSKFAAASGASISTLISGVGLLGNSQAMTGAPPYIQGLEAGYDTVVDKLQDLLSAIKSAEVEAAQLRGQNDMLRQLAKKNSGEKTQQPSSDPATV